ncbi:MAG: hypothetical protein HYY61_07105 [Deltaproteobacteria bacterium]|nr:hypothetical protein [Deltaproteobacteria bacterium]
MKRINIILMVMGLMAFALMVIGCGGEESEQQVLDAGHFAYDPNGGLTTQDQLTQVSFAATHEFTGTISEINDAEYSVLAPSDYSGIRTQVPQVTLKIKMKDANSALIERAELVITGADEKGLFSYRASCSEGSKNCGTYFSGTNVLNIKLYDSGGVIELRTIHPDVIQHKLGGDVVMDLHAQRLGKFDLSVRALVVKEVSNEIK